jgi:hypothetical protein
MKVANVCAELINEHNPDAVCIDAGNGTGIIDRLRELGFQSSRGLVWKRNPKGEEWSDKRTELWARMRDWLGGGCIDRLTRSSDDLTGPEYKFHGLLRQVEVGVEGRDEEKRACVT